MSSRKKVSDDYTKSMLDDLQLAAELGKTLLERNKELETTLKQHQNIIEDQTLEIGYLTKQTTALREVNESRLRIYEQLEGSIQDLERANHRLVVENTADKKQIKSLNNNVENLETKCDELQNIVDDLNLQIDILKRKVIKPPEIVTHTCCKYNSECTDFYETDRPKSPEPHKKAKSNEKPQKCQNERESLDLELANEQLSQLMSQLRENKTLFARDQVRVAELEDQLASVIRQNQSLEKQVNQLRLKDDQSKSMHEELSSLDEFRQGQLCCRCLRTIDSTRASETLSYLDDEVEDDDDSMLNALINDPPVHRSSFTMEIEDYNNDKTSSPQLQEPNLYRELVEKYEALLEVQRNQSPRKCVNNLSLQDELQLSGNFNQKKDTDDESGHGDSLQPDRKEETNRKSASRTPTDFSEAETNSSGFSDETSNKGTQTEGRFGSFLCTIADGDDCKFSIYDDTSAMDSRFCNRPEYREIFANIFQVLKKAAENQDEGEKLPLLDDRAPVKSSAKPLSARREDISDFGDNLTDDTQSVMSSTVSELSTNQTDISSDQAKTCTNKTEMSTPIIINAHVTATSQAPAQPVLMPYRRQPLEYLSVGVNVRKNSSSKRRKQHSKDRSDRPITPVLGPTTVTYSNRPGRKLRKEPQNKSEQVHAWNGNTLTIYSQKKSPLAQENNKNYDNTIDYKPGTALKDLSKLKRLDLSYAEVVRNADNNKHEAPVRQQTQTRQQAQTRQRRK